MASAEFPHIFSSGRIGRFITQNRVKYAACSVSNFNTRDGFVTEREFARDMVIARTGSSIMTNQGAYPDKAGEGKAYFRQLSINDDRYIPGLRRIAELFHQHGALAVQQILHGGRYGGIELGYCIQPSEVQQTLRHFRPPREMTKDQIARVIEDHAEAAKRAMAAGFDGVEITGFMGYLVSNFNSRFTNKRKDEYGGSLHNRGRFMRELLEATRRAVGPEKLVIIRLNGTELMDEFGGNSEDECMELMAMAAEMQVDMISMVIGWHESRRGALGRDVGRDQWLYLAERAKKVIGHVPLAFGPRLSDPWKADRAIRDGIFDYWEICRPFLSDPELLHKLRRGEPEKIKPCIGCLLCLAKMFANQPYLCAVNPVLGHEDEPQYRIAPAVRKKKVMVVGGGPAGLEAAIAAARRGHSVSLFEQRDRLGGGLIPASREIGGGEVLMELLAYYEGLVKELNVDVRLNTWVDRKVAASFAPEVVVLATGAKIDRLLPARQHCADRMVDAHRLLVEGLKSQAEEVVVLGGGKVGLVTAEYLAAKGKRVTIVEQNARVDFDVSTTFRWRHAAWVNELGIETLCNTRVMAVEEDGVVIMAPDGEKRRLRAEMVVLAGPLSPRQQLSSELEYLCDELYIIGDALMPRSLYNAIHEGYRLGTRI